MRGPLNKLSVLLEADYTKPNIRSRCTTPRHSIQLARIANAIHSKDQVDWRTPRSVHLQRKQYRMTGPAYRVVFKHILSHSVNSEFDQSPRYTPSSHDTRTAMALNCSLHALQVPVLPGANITAFEVNLVQNYSGIAMTQLYTGHPTVSADNATFCNVTVAYEHIDANDTVHVETWLPMDNYNGRIQAYGGGGWVAGRFSITFNGMIGALGAGYAASTTDAGLILREDLTPESWALTVDGSPNMHALEDLASVSLHDQVCQAPTPMLRKAILTSMSCRLS